MHGEWITLWFLSATSSVVVLALQLFGVTYYSTIFFLRDNGYQYNRNLNADDHMFYGWKAQLQGAQMPTHRCQVLVRLGSRKVGSCH